jgi:ectoine hydroxylase-related dioxygenase (phytanoyl-CoA dioxygenase family)
MTPKVLSTQQQRRFKRDGYLVLEDALGDDLVADGRQSLEASVPEDLKTKEGVVGVGSRSPEPSDTEPIETINERLYEYGAALVGDALVEPEGPDMQFALRYPRDIRLAAHHDRRPDFGHLDGYGGSFKDRGEYGGFTVGAVVYFDDVVERGGGFTVWPGSHWVAAEYFSDHSVESPGIHGQLPAIDDEGDWDYSRRFDEQCRSRELAGDAGTVVLWHNKLVHTAGVNQSPNVRVAGIRRFRREDFDDVKRDAAEKPFAYWPAIADLPPATTPTAVSEP